MAQKTGTVQRKTCALFFSPVLKWGRTRLPLTFRNRKGNEMTVSPEELKGEGSLSCHQTLSLVAGQLTDTDWQKLL